MAVIPKGTNTVGAPGPGRTPYTFPSAGRGSDDILRAGRSISKGIQGMVEAGQEEEKKRKEYAENLERNKQYNLASVKLAKDADDEMARQVASDKTDDEIRETYKARYDEFWKSYEPDDEMAAMRYNAEAEVYYEKTTLNLDRMLLERKALQAQVAFQGKITHTLSMRDQAGFLEAVGKQERDRGYSMDVEENREIARRWREDFPIMSDIQMWSDQLDEGIISPEDVSTTLAEIADANVLVSDYGKDLLEKVQKKANVQAGINKRQAAVEKQRYEAEAAIDTAGDLKIPVEVLDQWLREGR
ncbi:MAG: cytochrome c-type biogenesis protein, partial [Planctomycetota bacterium]